MSIEDYSDLDTSSELEFGSNQGSIIGSNCDDELDENLEPKLSDVFEDEYENAPQNPQAQLQARLDAVRLAQLHADIKARAQLPNPTYQKLLQSQPPRPFDVRILPNYVQHPIDYFELFWGPEVQSTLVENTNAYAQYKEARHKEIAINDKKSR